MLIDWSESASLMGEENVFTKKIQHFVALKLFDWIQICSKERWAFPVYSNAESWMKLFLDKAHKAIKWLWAFIWKFNLKWIENVEQNDVNRSHQINVCFMFYLLVYGNLSLKMSNFWVAKAIHFLFLKDSHILVEYLLLKDFKTTFQWCTMPKVPLLYI